MKLGQAFARQVEACAGLDSPFMAQLLRLLVARFAMWPGEETHALGRVDFHGRWMHRRGV